MKGTDQILAERVVDGGLASDTGIHLSQDRRRHLHHVNAAQEAGGDKTTEVTHDPATEGHHPGASVEPGLEHGAYQGFHGGQILAPLAGRVGHGEHLEAGVAQADGGDCRQVVRQGRVRDQGATVTQAEVATTLPERLEDVVTDDDVIVTAVGQIDADGGHEPPHRRTARSRDSSSALLDSVERTVMSAMA